MGLDCYPMGKALPGHEEEWEKLIKICYDPQRHETEGTSHRLLEISDAPFELVGAPQVGKDKEADEWMLGKKDPDRTESDEEWLRINDGYYVLELVRGICDGVPEYSNGGLYDGIDETSFRGSALELCEGLIKPDNLYTAWMTMPPEAAVKYGRALLENAEASYRPPPEPLVEPGFLGKLFGAKPKTRKPVRPPATANDIEEMRDILRSAGRWYIFWGELGHPIATWF